MKEMSVKVAISDAANAIGSEVARPIAMLVQLASEYDSSIYINFNAKHVNAKSIMGVMTLALKNGDDVHIVTNGSDEEVACEKIGRYLAGV